MTALRTGLALALALSTSVMAAGLDSPADAPEVPVEPAPEQPAGPVALAPGSVPESVAAVAREVRALPLPQRVDAISGALLGVSYAVDPAGEGAGEDSEPPARYDLFDCLTFVEEVIALSLAGDPIHASDVRRGLRYGQTGVDYAARRHFMELQWIPGALADGWLADVTDTYGPTETMTRDVTAETWQAWSRRGSLSLADEQLPIGEMSLRVLPLETARAVAEDIAPGTLLLVVRVDQPWHGPLWVTHAGLVVGGEGPTFRHATRMGARVRDHALAWYLEYLGGYENRPTKGVVLLEPREQGPRRSRLASPERADVEPPVHLDEMDLASP